MSAAASSSRDQRLSLDHPSFEKLLAAAWVLQCLHDQLHDPQARGVETIVESAGTQEVAEIASAGLQSAMKAVVQPSPRVTEVDSKHEAPSVRPADDETLAELVKTHEAIETGILNLDATVKRLISLSPKLTSEPATLEAAPHEPVPVEPAQVKVTPVEPSPSRPAQHAAVASPTKPSSVLQKPPNSKKPESHASSFNVGTTLNRPRGSYANYRATFGAVSTLRSLRAVTIANPVNLQTAGSRLRGAFAYFRANLSLRSLRAATIAIPADLQTALNRLRRTFAHYRATLRRRTDKEPAVRGSLLNLGTTLNRLGSTFPRSVSTFRVSFTLRSLRAVAIATPVWLLAVIANLLLLETWLHEPFHSGQTPSPSTAEAAVTTNAPTPTGSTRAASQPAKRIESTNSQRPTPIPSLAVSHEQITDLATSSVVQQLSRYEIDGLRRQARYGDDSAAFTLGMAYEIGHYVRQNCVEAARWVTMAAEAGNAAAQYNLGLRYRDGDGVSADLRESKKWLRQAAAHRNPEAKLALQLLASR
jgi:hypothetical protein